MKNGSRIESNSKRSRLWIKIRLTEERYRLIIENLTDEGEKWFVWFLQIIRFGKSLLSTSEFIREHGRILEEEEPKTRRIYKL